jgi:hypothetical protein
MDFFSGLPAHCAMIIGRRGCGKSMFACELLETSFKDHFDSVVIICPTYEINSAYDRKWIDNKTDKNVYVVGKKTFEQYDLNRILLHLAKRFECCGETLFLVDDCAYLGSVRNRDTALTKLAFTSRHAGISIWVITQKYNSVSKCFREQSSWVILFYCKDKDSFLYATDENNVLNADDKLKAAEFLKNTPHGKLLIRTDTPIEFKLLL